MKTNSIYELKLYEQPVISKFISQESALDDINAVKEKLDNEIEWKKYSSFSSQFEGDDLVNHQINWLFGDLCDIDVENYDQSHYQIVKTGYNKLEVRFSNHPSNERNYKQFQFNNNEGIDPDVIYEFVFTDRDSETQQSIPYGERDRYGRQRRCPVYYKMFERTHLNYKEDILAILEALENLVETGQYIEPVFSGRIQQQNNQNTNQQPNQQSQQQTNSQNQSQQSQQQVNNQYSNQQNSNKQNESFDPFVASCHKWFQKLGYPIYEEKTSMPNQKKYIKESKTPLEECYEWFERLGIKI